MANSRNPNNDGSRGKPLGALYITLALLVVIFVVAPWLASKVGLLTLREYSVLFIVAAVIGILLNTFYGLIASGKIQYHQMGYTFCVTTLGAALSNWAAQLATDDDLLPGVGVLAAENEFWTFWWMGASSEDIIAQRLRKGFFPWEFVFRCLSSSLPLCIPVEGCC